MNQAAEGSAENQAGQAIDLDDAYAVTSPEDNRRLYARWADTYESGFIERRGYLYHAHVAAAFADGPTQAGPLLDVGCGTGLVGVALRRLGAHEIDGADISAEMLAKAGEKADGGAVYRRLFEVDLTEPLPIPENSYAGIVSAGVFTHGHLPPEPLGELLRVAMPSARFAVGVNAVHFEELGFARWLDAAVADGRIDPYDLRKVNVYSDSDPDAVDDWANLVLFNAAGGV